MKTINLEIARKIKKVVEDSFNNEHQKLIDEGVDSSEAQYFTNGAVSCLNIFFNALEKMAQDEEDQ